MIAFKLLLSLAGLVTAHAVRGWADRRRWERGEHLN